MRRYQIYILLLWISPCLFGEKYPGTNTLQENLIQEAGQMSPAAEDEIKKLPIAISPTTIISPSQATPQISAEDGGQFDKSIPAQDRAIKAQQAKTLFTQGQQAAKTTGDLMSQAALNYSLQNAFSTNPDPVKQRVVEILMNGYMDNNGVKQEPWILQEYNQESDSKQNAVRSQSHHDVLTEQFNQEGDIVELDASAPVQAGGNPKPNSGSPSGINVSAVRARMAGGDLAGAAELLRQGNRTPLELSDSEEDKAQRIARGIRNKVIYRDMPEGFLDENGEITVQDIPVITEVTRAPGFEDSNEIDSAPTTNSVGQVIRPVKKNTTQYNDDELRQMGIRNMPGVSIFRLANFKIKQWQSQKPLFQRSSVARY